MSKKYLKDLHSKIILDPSQIKYFIQDLPNLTDKLLFSKLPEEDEVEMLYDVLEVLLKRISISARRSKQAFTSMWDNLKRFLEIVLNDALKIENRARKIDLILRKILQLGIKPEEGEAEISCNWLAMDWDTQLGKLKYSRKLEYVDIIENELNLKTLFLYCDRFQVNSFTSVFLKLTNPTSDIIKLFFKNYYNQQLVCEYIESRDEIPIEVIMNLRALVASEWISFPCVELLISKITKSIFDADGKSKCVYFELLTEISEVIDYRKDAVVIRSLLVDIVNSIDIVDLSDVVLGKYWSVVSSLLSSEQCVIPDLEPKIFYTLESESMIKAKVSVCRVISLYWQNITNKSGLFERLKRCVESHTNNKLKWNVAVSLMGYNCSTEEFNFVKEFWMKEMREMNNYKVMYSWTNLVLNWSVVHNYGLIIDSKNEDTIWTSLNHLKLFINANTDNLECEDGERIVEGAIKLENILKSILIGPNLERD